MAIDSKSPFAMATTETQRAAILEQVDILEAAALDLPDLIAAELADQSDLDRVTKALGQAKALKKVILNVK